MTSLEVPEAQGVELSPLLNSVRSPYDEGIKIENGFAIKTPIRGHFNTNVCCKLIRWLFFLILADSPLKTQRHQDLFSSFTTILG